MIRELTTDGLLQKTFAFDATNMLKEVVDSNLGTLQNEYNGLGFRVASNKPDENIEYLCDLSRDYYNLLERTVNGETESFIYDSNVVSMSKAGRNYYYLQDELGSPMYLTGTDGTAVSSYAFDDFGRNIDILTGQPKSNNAKQGYAKQGNIIQPFAFTGYQEDEISGLKFAQARFYDAKTGRFQSEDNVKGFISSPFSLNHYGYCWGNSIGLVDKDGNLPDWVTDAADYISDSASKVWNKYLFGKETTVTYSLKNSDIKGMIGVDQTIKKTKVVSDDGDRIFKIITDVDKDTDEVTTSFGINIGGFFGGTKNETGAKASLELGVSTGYSISGKLKVKGAVKGTHADVSINPSIGVEKIASLDAHGGVGFRENTFGVGAAVEGLKPTDIIKAYGYHDYKNGDLTVNTEGKVYIRTAVAYIVIGELIYYSTGNPTFSERALAICTNQ